MRVLIVDDDPVTVEMLSEHLRHWGYDTHAARDGSEAFEIVRTGRYRLVISDWQMPGMDGLTLCREIRKRSTYGYIYFILLTSNTGAENVVCGLDAGADDFLSKPFHPQELRMRVRTGERVLALQGRDLLIFAMAKLAECATGKRVCTWNGCANTAACWPKSSAIGPNTAPRSTEITCSSCT